MFRRYSRYLIYILEIYILNAVQEIPEFNLFGIPSFWTVPSFVCISLFEKEFTSMAVGILSGLLIDLSLGCFLGLNALILGILGYILGVIFSYYVRTNFLSALFISGIVLVLILAVNILVNFSSNEFKNHEIYDLYLPIVILTILITLPVYFFNRTISYMTREKRNE